MECSVGQKEWRRYFSYILFSVKTFSNINLLCVGGQRRQLIELGWLSFHKRIPQKEVLVLTTILLAFFDLKKKKIKSLLTYLRGLFYGQRHGSNRTTLASATTERNISKTKYKCFWAPAGVHSNDTGWWYETICSDNSVVGVLLFKCRNLYEKKILISCQHPFLFVLHLFAS